MPFSERQGERAISLVLRYGSLVATVVMALGLGLMLAGGPDHTLFTYHRVALPLLIPRLMRFDPAALTEFGIILLLLTPIFRILVAMATFALERDIKYVFVALGVLAVILLSISFAIEG